MSAKPAWSTGSKDVARVESRRVQAFDTLRGLTLVSMILFHAAYDAAYLYEVPLPWFTHGAFQDIWRASISWTFLLLAGWMTAHSRSNFRRALQYALVSVAIYVVTNIASIDTPISFGIIFCMAASTALYAIIAPVTSRFNPLLMGLGALGLFALFQHVPDALYPVKGLEWLGFPTEGFYSGDYYPVLPYSLLYLSGAFFARAWTTAHPGIAMYPDWMYRLRIPVVSWLGSHSLGVYLAHQPLLLALFSLIPIPGF